MRIIYFLILAGTVFFLSFMIKPENRAFIRINEVGYRAGDVKEAIIFSDSQLRGNFSLIDQQTGKPVFEGRLQRCNPSSWGNYKYYYTADFSAHTTSGRYRISLAGSEDLSALFRIGPGTYNGYPEDLLKFLRQQRCGYNPYLDVACHQLDGRTMYGSMPDSSYVDVSGGWHDAGDQLKYLITSSFAAGFMLLSYELEPTKFSDETDDLGRPGANGIPDVLDEAKWGLDWILKLHPYPGVLIHQVADDRDHRGWKWPDQDPSDYGWGKNKYRVAYIATGEPQGLGRYKSEATGIANVAGRSAAALSLGYRVLMPFDSVYADKCLRAAMELYAMGKEKEGYQQGNSFGAPYRYNEETWTDDMEWAAAELYTNTGRATYLQDAVRYAKLTPGTSWMDHDSASHYQYFPYINVGHFALYPLVDAEMQQELAGYYRTGIENVQARAEKNPFRIGVPFIWCSNFLVTALVSQVILYEKMTGDMTYHSLMIAHRDWLLGRNPWGTSMFTRIPAYGEYPLDIHTSIWALTHREVPGGLVDGPVYASIYNNLKGLTLTAEDEFAPFQNNIVVYHDDIGDYSTNEPTMDGSASAVLLMATFSDSR